MSDAFTAIYVIAMLVVLAAMSILTGNKFLKAITELVFYCTGLVFVVFGSYIVFSIAVRFTNAMVYNILQNFR